ncbi:polysialyltransferase family glycosyltransferase [Vibrio crassostreae]|uniref:polysialyltransferase family glycosyltransferase n=1 Tax=Vibrio crassostreae TaxID=246167 RepID=UPI000F493B23|nr:polysialyltransferase family glycosyltransferase [Vibrio crassostreae]ROP20097.1 hypothetical protein EDB33_108167 [Vibrio crassostreae]ROP21812.1 hypothetical protein EDB34_10876 [Vibrio crassostreae]RPE97650.1 hypothetical protein EDB15_105111 [Vibrio crassostreae]TCN70874.1 hypothetical protein EDB60_105131 [Vibrio crassostreae]TCV10628.1 hypothetical protein EDB16_109131 [Vibrio crassostreae]
MNNNAIYVCSTLRHLLFSLARASSKGEQSLIIFFVDYQGISQDALNTRSLPSNIKLVLLERSYITKSLKNSFWGRCLLVASLRGLRFNRLTMSMLKKELTRLTPINPESFDNGQLFLFNDNNKMSRLFKLLSPNYEIIEDGIGNYLKVAVKGTKRYVRFLSGKTKNFWVFGESPRCTKINVLYPEKLPKEVKHKGAPIEFLKHGLELKLINDVFKFSPLLNDEENIIIATQPKSKRILSLLSSDDFFISIYKEVEKYYKNRGVSVKIKLHPSENIASYKKYFGEDQFLSVKHPLELELLNNPNKKNIVVSINSSAGLGFEKFCIRKTLTKDGDMDHFCNSIVAWQGSEDIMKDDIERVLNS